MKSIINKDFCSITDLKRSTNSVLEQIHKTKRPVILTVNGKAEAVIVDAKEFEKMSKAFNLIKRLNLAEQDISKGRYKEAQTFFKKFL